MKWTKGLIALAIVIYLSQICCAQVHAHKSDSEVERMTPDRHVREYCEEFYHHGLQHRDYMKLLDDSITRDGLRAVPPMVEIINEFDPTNTLRSGRERDDSSYAAEILLGSLEGSFRLRAIDAIKRVTEKMHAAHYDTAADEHERSKRLRYEIALGILKDLQGNNDYDRAVQETFNLRFKIKVSDEELFEFSNYLISQDPHYPSWGELDWYIDHNQINDAGNPAQYSIVQNIEPFFKAYQKFKHKPR